MAKQTALQLVNIVLNNLGDVPVSTLAGITGAALFAFNCINEGIYDIAFEFFNQILETNTFVSMVTNQATYGKPAGIYAYDKDSFRYNEQKAMQYYAPKRFDLEYPVQTDTGIPRLVLDNQNQFKVYPSPALSENGNPLKFRAWAIPTPFNTSTDSATCWIPEGFDLTLLTDWATKKVLHYRHNEEESIYGVKIWGEERPDGKGDQGNMSRFQNLYASHQIEDGDIMLEPMEGVGGYPNGLFQTNPVNGP